jgi:CubicO group peptidase (beta-lactamase class C family)
MKSAKICGEFKFSGGETMIRHISLRMAVVLMILAAALAAAQSPASLPAATIEKVESAIKAEMSKQNIPGISAAIVTNHQLRWAKGFGMADLENSVPAKDVTVYRLASISKTITAVAAMQLNERGKLDLDTTIQKYCPAFPEKPWPITTRQLLGHLSGIRHYKNQEEVNSTRHYTTLVDALAMFKDEPLLQEPGTKYTYTTIGYSVLGCVVEGASGVKFVDYIRENIFKPAGMDTMRPDDVYEIIPNRAQGYRKLQSGELRNSSLADTSNKVPGGGLCSTVADLAKFAITVQTGKLVKPETLAPMWTRQKTRDGQPTNYGLGWFLDERNGQKEVWHTGGQQRVSTILYMRPDQRLAVVLMSNLEGAGLTQLARQIADLVLQRQ